MDNKLIYLEKLKRLKELRDLKAYSKTDSALEGVKQGGSLGFADEIAGAIDAGLSKTGNLFVPEGGKNPYEDLPVSEVYTSGRDEERQKAALAQQSNPNSYMLGQLAGGVATTLPISGLKGAAAVGGMAGAGGSDENSVEGLVKDTAVGVGTGAIGSKIGDLVGAIIAKAQTARPVAETSKLAAKIATGLPESSVPESLTLPMGPYNQLPKIPVKGSEGLSGLVTGAIPEGLNKIVGGSVRAATGMSEAPIAKQVAQKGLDFISPIVRSADQSVQKIAGMAVDQFKRLPESYQRTLQQAAQQGGRSLAITQFLLGQDPVYQKALKEDQE